MGEASSSLGDDYTISKDRGRCPSVRTLAYPLCPLRNDVELPLSDVGLIFLILPLLFRASLSLNFTASLGILLPFHPKFILPLVISFFSSQRIP